MIAPPTADPSSDAPHIGKPPNRNISVLPMARPSTPMVAAARRLDAVGELRAADDPEETPRVRDEEEHGDALVVHPSRVTQVVGLQLLGGGHEDVEQEHAGREQGEPGESHVLVVMLLGHVLVVLEPFRLGQAVHGAQRDDERHDRKEEQHPPRRLPQVQDGQAPQHHAGAEPAGQAHDPDRVGPGPGR